VNNSHFEVPSPVNEEVIGYAPGTPRREELKRELARQSAAVADIPLVIDGREVRTGRTGAVVMPHDLRHKLAEFHIAGEPEMNLAMNAATEAKHLWANMPWEHRASIFLKAAELIAGPWRARINAATMLGQSKTAHQAEIDAACELIDFLRYNVFFANEIFKDQPNNTQAVWNRLEYRPLDGFVVAVSPFNFTSIGGNLCTAPAIVGNTVIWKPARTATLSNYVFMRILMEAGLPAGVINFLPCGGDDLSRYVLIDPRMAGFHFTGSTRVFSGVWSLVGGNIKKYHSYPRIVGETGGKDFVFAHPSAEVEPLVAALVLGAFEYQGQKCSAASRAYIPSSLWPEARERLLSAVSNIKCGDPRDFTNFCGAVIDEPSYGSIAGYIEEARRSPDAELLCGGCDDSKGYFVYPTVILTRNPEYRTMVEEIFGPVLTVYVYPDEDYAGALNSCVTASPYALTGAAFARDRSAIIHMEQTLCGTAGNFYINDKPTGAVVGHQPFGGGRASGTNDKAGSMLNLYRWISPRTIKENFLPTRATTYPFMLEE